MDFLVLAQIFEKISAEASRIEMTKMLADLFQQAGIKEIGIICNLSLSMLRPPYKGTQFNFAEKSMIPVVASVLNISSDEVKSRLKTLGDLGLVVAEGDWKPSEELSVDQVYNALCDFEEISGVGSQEEKMDQAIMLLQKVDPICAKYIVKIILGTLRLGFSDMTLIDALSWMEAGDKSLRKRIENAYNVCADIGLIASTLKQDGMEGIDDMHIQVGIPIRPAAAERMPTAKAIIDKIGHCVAQPKLDGFRLQIHLDKTKDKPEVHFFSRNLIDMSYMFPDLVEELIKLDVDQLVCEGEAIVYDPNTGKFLPFQETVKRKRKHGIDQAVSDFPLQVFIFDLLYLDGKEYLSLTHKDRREALLSLFKNVKTDTVQVIEEKAIETAKELEDYFLQNIDAGLEGLVVKKEDSQYQPGKRNFNWIKLKRQEEGHLEDTVDCVVLGYYAGKGKRASFGIGAFLVGVYNKETDTFETVAKIGTGLKDDEWKDLKKRCDAVSVSQQPKNVTCPKDLYPAVWVSPEIVCSVRADEITLSPLHTSGKTETQLGYALRFPRFVMYRPDKSPEQTTGIDELETLYKDQFIQARKKKKK